MSTTSISHPPINNTWEKETTRTGRHARLDYFDVALSGPAARPLEFPAPTVGQAVRLTTRVYEPTSGEDYIARNVLFPFRYKENSPISDRAYWIRRKICDSTHGSVRIGVVLKRRRCKEKCEPNEFARPGWSYYRDNRSDDNETRSQVISEYVSQQDDFVWDLTSDLVAIKFVQWSKVRHMRGRHLEDPIKEVGAGQFIGNYHPHVLGLIDVVQDDKYLYSISPFCTGGDLYSNVMKDFKRNNPGRFTESRARHWFKQLLLGIHHLQKKGICHRDLTLENILVNNDKLTIIDLGMCLRVPYSDPNNTGSTTDASADTVRRLIRSQGQGGKYPYIAPEIIENKPSFDGFASDLWSAGVILYIMIVGKAPFKWAHDSDTRFLSVVNGGLAETLKYFPITSEASDLLQNMFWKDPSKRLNLFQIMKHPWVVNNEFKPLTPSVKDTSQRSLWWRVIKDDASSISTASSNSKYSIRKKKKKTKSPQRTNSQEFPIPRFCV